MTPLQRSRFQAQATLQSHKISLVKITLHQVKVLHENKGESDSLSLDCAQPASVQIAPTTLQVLFNNRAGQKIEPGIHWKL